MRKVDLINLREAIEKSWNKDTAYGGSFDPSNPSLGQCYVSSWVVQYFFPEFEIYEGQVDTGKQDEKHFWAELRHAGDNIVLDLTWQQFPGGSHIKERKHRDRKTLNGSEDSIRRRELLLSRVKEYLGHS